MARPLRLLVPDGIYHVYARGVNKRAVFRDARDNAMYLRLLERAVARRHWQVMAYCLMGNHLHLLVQTPDADLSRGMQELHGEYARRFNLRHDRVGHVFQGRFGAKLIRDDAQLWTAVAYLATNPVKAGLCAAAAEWPWSNVRYALGHEPGPPWLATSRLLAHLDNDPEVAVGQLRRLVGDGQARAAAGSE